MSLLRCCCGGAPCASCPSLPSDWSTRDYRLFIPAVKPVGYGRASAVPSGLYTGPCTPADPYWDLAECAFDFTTGSLYYVHSRLANCEPFPEACGEVLKFPREIGGFYTDNLVPSITFSTQIATRTYNQTGDVSYLIQADVSRCWGGWAGCESCTNRTKVYLYYFFGNNFTYNDNCTNHPAGVVKTVELEYLSNPYAASEGIGKTCYLRSWKVSPGPTAFCYPETGLYGCTDPCVLGSCSFFGSSNFPQTVTIV